MAIPIFFIHEGDAPYLKFTLHQAKFYNPDSEIYLIGNKENDKYPFVKHIDSEKLKQAAKTLEQNYVHMSNNDYKLEFFCFKRWFFLKAAVEKFKIDGPFIHLDTDVLLYTNLDVLKPMMNKFELTVCKGKAAQYALFREKSVLNRICETILSFYSDGEINNILKEKYRHHVVNNLAGGVCDMDAFDLFREQNSEKVVDIFGDVTGGLFDNNFNLSEGYEITKEGHKKITLVNGVAHAQSSTNLKLVKVHGLHFQGGGKRYIPLNYSLNKYKIESIAYKIRMLLGAFKQKAKKLLFAR